MTDVDDHRIDITQQNGRRQKGPLVPLLSGVSWSWKVKLHGGWGKVGKKMHRKQPRMNSGGFHHQKWLCLYQVATHENCSCLVSYISTLSHGKSQRICCKVSWTSGVDQSIELFEKTRLTKKNIPYLFGTFLKRNNFANHPSTITNHIHPCHLHRGTDIPWPRWSNQKCPPNAKGRHPPRWSKSSNNLQEKWDSIKRFGI